MKRLVHCPSKKCITICLLLIMPLLTTNLYAVMVYNDVDFSSPTHTAGGEPTFSDAIDTPSSSRFGSTLVVPSPTGNQTLLFNTTGNDPSFYYDQIQFDLEHMQDTYHLSFDVYTENLIGSRNKFSTFLDPLGPFGMDNNGSIYFGYPDYTMPAPYYTTLATYEDRTLYHIDISCDIPNERKVILIDGQVVADSQGGAYPEDIRSARFSLGLYRGGSSTPPDNSTNVVIDNILITNGFVVPEPASIGLIGLFAVGIWFKRRFFVA